MTIQFQQVFNTDRLFNTYPPSSMAYARELMFLYISIIVAAFVVYAAVAFLFPNKKQTLLKKFSRKICRYFVGVALLGVLFVISRLQYIAFFSMRFFLLVNLLAILSMIWYFVYEWVYEYPKYQTKFLQQIEKEKYLPRRKTRR